ncbi:MAG: hypothetical protein ACREWG_08015 [Gammaproteobacteria bacterium]
MACDPLITDPFEFPRRPHNRPSLPRIAYRIGRYADFVEAMTRAIDVAPELATWTHRDPDDPGIALLQGAAILGDILSFYQEHYANEAFLRTAAWRESVAELVRLTGYRLAPGIGGRATLAFEARGTAPLVIRQGFPVKADLADLPTPADFETDAELTAWPHLGRFNLYRARQYAASLPAGAKMIELESVGGATDSASLTAFDLKVGDRLMLVAPEPVWTSAGNTLTATQKAPQLVKVKKLTHILGRVLFDLDGVLDETWVSPVQAYRIGRTFRHFGHNAPPTTISNLTNASGTITGSQEFDTGFDRHVYPNHQCLITSASAPLPAHAIPLDQEITDLTAGVRVIVQASVGISASAARVALAAVKTIRSVTAGTLGFGNLNGATTWVYFDSSLVKHAGLGSPLSDIRDWRIHEVTSAALTLRPPASFAGNNFASGTDALYFYGTATHAKALAGRRLYLSHADGRSVDLVGTNAATDFAPLVPDAPQMWPLSFDRTPMPFTRADFDETNPTVTVFGNLVDASQGKSEREAVLGNGDNRQRFQTFPLPKAPLTYFVSAAAIPPQMPEIEIWVNGRLWTRVDTFFGHGPKEEIYIVREDAEGRSFVQFGDGESGARLPSGVKNVKAIYRTGSGARGPIKPGATPTASERPPGFDKVTLAGIVSGGADPEDQERARVAAPGKVQSLGRLVSIRDYETETLAIPGVVTATATWDLHAGVPAVVLRVLLEAGREAEFSEVRAAIAHAQRCRGPDRFALVVEQALLRYAFADVTYARDPTYQQSDVEAALRAALGLAGDAANESQAQGAGLLGAPRMQRTGLFGLHARRFGEREYASRIEGRLQNVAGIVWCKVSALGLFPAPAPDAPPLTDPATLVLPPAPRTLVGTLDCSAHELLQLADLHLTLTAIAEPTGDCV